jgi:V/A-type H+/Na+-transporting ATPase subunit E
MSDGNDISGLETALAERARKLADEHLVNGRQARELILTETRQRLHIEEEREELAAKARAERAYQQRVQAAELDLRAGLDRLRWELANAALTKLPPRLSALAEDEVRYLPLVRDYMRACAQAIERDELIVQLNARDLPRMEKDWTQYAIEAAPGKRLTLSPDPLNSIGGVLMVSADGDIRFDNTFEGRMERLAETLQGAIAEWLIPQSGAAAYE